MPPVWFSVVWLFLVKDVQTMVIGSDRTRALASGTTDCTQGAQDLSPQFENHEAKDSDFDAVHAYFHAGVNSNYLQDFNTIHHPFHQWIGAQTCEWGVPFCMAELESGGIMQMVLRSCCDNSGVRTHTCSLRNCRYCAGRLHCGEGIFCLQHDVLPPTVEGCHSDLVVVCKLVFWQASSSLSSLMLKALQLGSRLVVYLVLSPPLLSSVNYRRSISKSPLLQRIWSTKDLKWRLLKTLPLAFSPCF